MKKISMVLIVFLLVSCGTALEDISGYYEGSIDINGSKLPISLEFQQEKNIEGVLNIEVQGISGVELRDISSQGQELEFMVDFVSTKVYFKGSFTEDTYSGNFTQNGVSYPFEVVRSEKILNENAEVFELKRDDITLSGEYLIPEGAKQIALIIAGSGPTDYNGNSSAGVYANSYLYLAEALEEAGIASLRYNKRILGNPIKESDLSFDDFVSDAKAIVELLDKDERFDEIYIIGHSQGALIAQIVASQVTVDKVVLLTGAGRSIDEVLYDQINGQVDEATLEAAKNIMLSLKNGETVDEVPVILQSLFRADVQPFLISWMKYDPKEWLNTISCDVQIINGSLDIQVDLSEGELLKSVRDDVRWDIISNMNHILKETSDQVEENLATYQDINLPIHKELVAVLIEFFNE